MLGACVAGRTSVNSFSYDIPESFAGIISAASRITEFYRAAGRQAGLTAPTFNHTPVELA